MRPAFSLHGRNPKNDEGLLGPVKFPGIPALDRAARPIRRYHHPIRYNAREGKSGKNRIALNDITRNNPQLYRRETSLPSIFVVYLPRSIPSSIGPTSVRR